MTVQDQRRGDAALHTPPELADLDARLSAARQRVTELEAQRHGRGRRARAAHAAIESYYADLEHGGKPDPKREKALRGELAALEQGLMRRVVNERGSTREVLIDVELEGRIRAAHEVVADAENAIREYVREHRRELQDALTRRSIKARDDLLAAIEQLSKANGEWKRTRNQWIEYGERWGDIAPADLPPNPLSSDALADIELTAMQATGGARDPRGLLPMPPALAPGSEDEQRHQHPLRGWENAPLVVSTAGRGAPATEDALRTAYERGGRVKTEPNRPRPPRQSLARAEWFAANSGACRTRIVRGSARRSASRRGGVQEWLGHHSATFTFATYVHLMDDGLGDADALDGALIAARKVAAGGTPGVHTDSENGRNSDHDEAVENG